MDQQLDIVSDGPPRYSEVTAVILAGGVSKNFSLLTETVPKPMIKLGGRTIIHHLLRLIVCAGFNDVIVVTSPRLFAQLDQHVESCVRSLTEEVGLEPIISVHSINHTGTTDVLGVLAGMVKEHFFIVPCDLYGQFDFKAFVDQHLSSPSLCTVALLDQLGPALVSSVPSPRPSARPASGHRSGGMNVCLGGNEFEEWSHRYRVVATLSEFGNSLLGIFQQIALESGDSFQLYKWHFPSNSRCVLRKNLIDVHVYAFSKRVFSLLSNEALLNSTIRMDLLPYIIKMQSTPLLTESQYASNSWNLPGLKDTYLVHYFLASGDLFKCSRINSLDSLYSANIQLCRKGVKKGKIKNAVIGNSEVSEACDIKNSVIGNNVTIGNNVKITDSVIMDNCTIEDDAVVFKSIIGDSVVLKKDSNLKNVVVKSGSTVMPGTTVEKDYIPSFSF